MCDMTHLCVWRDSFMCVTLLIHACDILFKSTTRSRFPINSSYRSFILMLLLIFHKKWSRSFAGSAVHSIRVSLLFAQPLKHPPGCCIVCVRTNTPTVSHTHTHKRERAKEREGGRGTKKESDSDKQHVEQ